MILTNHSFLIVLNMAYNTFYFIKTFVKKKRKLIFAVDSLAIPINHETHIFTFFILVYKPL